MTPSSHPSATPPRIQLCAGVVMHKRLRPVLNAFRYGVYFIRIPLRALQRGEVDLNRQWFSHNRWNLMSFYDADHGDPQRAPLDWVQALLQEQGITDADGEIILQCFPRVFGYVFNPVAFWFCHREDGSLRAIVCEVRNTFGEKHIYLLDKGSVLSNGDDLEAKKIFHVSPFCEVKGHYRFCFMSQSGSADQHLAKIDYFDEQGSLLLTSVSGKDAGFCDASILKLLWRYPWMTAGVVLRIHLQALRLWCKRVPFFSKPNPPSQEVSR
jgi:DUF1365 family protein